MGLHVLAHPLLEQPGIELPGAPFEGEHLEVALVPLQGDAQRTAEGLGAGGEIAFLGLFVISFGEPDDEGEDEQEDGKQHDAVA